MDIYGTLGPSCAEGPILVQMFQNGMTGIRLNLSHISLPEAAGLTTADGTADGGALEKLSVRVYDSSGRFVGVYRYDAEKKRWKAEKIFL